VNQGLIDSDRTTAKTFGWPGKSVTDARAKLNAALWICNETRTRFEASGLKDWYRQWVIGSISLKLTSSKSEIGAFFKIIPSQVEPSNSEIHFSHS